MMLVMITLILLWRSTSQRVELVQSLHSCIAQIDSITDARQDSVMSMDSMIARLKGPYVP